MQKVEKIFEYKGFDCAIVGQPHGCRCGYVRIPAGHLLFALGKLRKPYLQSTVLDHLSVHGGITYASASKKYPVPSENEEWWIGFDCAHAFDNPDPQLLEELNEKAINTSVFHDSEGSIKDVAFVEAELKQLVDQLEELKV